MKPYAEGRGWVLYHGDSVEVLPTFERASLGLVIADSPYGINTKSDGQGKLSPWADLCNASMWYESWIGSCRRALRHDAALWTFLNWRSMVTFTKASCALGWPIESLLVWDKSWIGPGGSRGLRPSYEMVALWCMPEFGIGDRGVPDIRQSPWSSTKPNGHPAEKPVDLLRWLVRLGRADGLPVCDPFVGCGSTGEACIREQVPFVGVELDERWCEVAAKRLRRAEEDTAMFAQVETPRAEEPELFAGGEP